MYLSLIIIIIFLHQICFVQLSPTSNCHEEISVGVGISKITKDIYISVPPAYHYSLDIKAQQGANIFAIADLFTRT